MKKLFLVLIASASISGFAAGTLDSVRADNKKKAVADSHFYDSKNRIYDMKDADSYNENPLDKGRFFAVTGTPVKEKDEIIIKSKELTYRIVNADAAKIKVNVYGTFNIVITEKIKKNEFRVEILIPLPKDELAEYKKNGHFPAIRAKTNE